jgi:sigma-B regulation protein RsbU (phosphoserine phosphatase)
VTNIIRAGALSGIDMKRPDQVLAKLNEVFPGRQHGQKFFTIWYGVYRSATRMLTWAGGGHPPRCCSWTASRSPGSLLPQAR